MIVGSTQGETIVAHQQRPSAARQRQGARGHRPRHRPPGDHRRRRSSATARRSAASSRRAIRPMSISPGSRTTIPRSRKALLAEAGVSDLTLTFKVPPAAYARAAAPIIQQQLAAVGIKVNVVNVEWADWIANVFQGAYDYDLTMVSHVEANDFAAFGKPGYYLNYDATALNELVDRAQRHHRSGQADRAQAGDPEAARRGLRGRSSLRAAQHHGRRQGRAGPVGKCARSRSSTSRRFPGRSELGSRTCLRALRGGEPSRLPLLSAFRRAE